MWTGTTCAHACIHPFGLCMRFFGMPREPASMYSILKREQKALETDSFFSPNCELSYFINDTVSYLTHAYSAPIRTLTDTNTLHT